MKKLHITLALLFILFPVSCVELSTEDDADQFVGIYSMSITESVVWGSASGTLSSVGALTITKINASKIAVNAQYGNNGEFFRTTGEVSGNMLALEGISTQDSSGHITTTFSTAELNGNILTFYMYNGGTLKDNGIAYPYRSTSMITAIKK